MDQSAHKRRKSAALAGAALVLALSLAAVALASVTVYRNGFPNRSAAAELSHAEGSHCDKTWRDKSQAIRVEVKKGPETCGYRPPVQGEADQPNQIIQARMKVLTDTPSHLRDNTFVGLAVRSGGGTDYELRVYPKGRRFELLRRPGGSGGFPKSGQSGAIAGVSDANVLRLSAVGDRVKAYVNGKKVASVTDPNPSAVGGRKVEVFVGDDKATTRSAFGNFDDLRVAVPNP